MSFEETKRPVRTHSRISGMGAFELRSVVNPQEHDAVPPEGRLRGPECPHMRLGGGNSSSNAM